MISATANTAAVQAAQLSEHATMDFTETVEFLITGGVVVYGTLTLLALLGVIGGKIFTWLEGRYGDVDDPEARRVERARRKAELEEEARVTAVISAAVAEVLQGRPHRVVSFRQLGPTRWSFEGRTQHHSSHKVR